MCVRGVCVQCACMCTVRVVMQHNQLQVVTLLQSTQLYKWGPDGLVSYWGSSPTNCSINGYLAQVKLGEANAQLSLSHLAV